MKCRNIKMQKKRISVVRTISPSELIAICTLTVFRKPGCASGSCRKLLSSYQRRKPLAPRPYNLVTTVSVYLTRLRLFEVTKFSCSLVHSKVFKLFLKRTKAFSGSDLTLRLGCPEEPQLELALSPPPPPGNLHNANYLKYCTPKGASHPNFAWNILQDHSDHFIGKKRQEGTAQGRG